MSGKGSNQRPRYISDQEWFEKWEAVYGKKEKNFKSKVNVCATGEVIKKDDKKI
jgi:hypothetical protein